MTDGITLLDVGEREILRTIIGKFVPGAGDDCALIPMAGGALVATTDPVPPPAAMSIGGSTDVFFAGWLLVAINGSDLAASGAAPVAFLAAIECESETDISDFERLLEGVRAACDDCGLEYAGGNIREAKAFSAVGTAIGWCEGYPPIRRSGAQPNDILISVGTGGIFWRDALAALGGKQVEDSSPLFRPRPQIRTMNYLAKARIPNAAMDNSDGLLPTLVELSLRNNLAIELDIDALTVAQVPADDPVGAARMWLGWGDWNVIASIPADKVDKARSIAAETGSSLTPIARFLDGPGPVFVKRGTRQTLAPRLESERFTRDSWMRTGIDGYIDLLKNVDLP